MRLIFVVFFSGFSEEQSSIEHFIECHLMSRHLAEYEYYFGKKILLKMYFKAVNKTNDIVNILTI